MKIRLVVLAALLSSTALAQPQPRPPSAGFTRVTSFQQCSTSTMFACGMRDANGNTYGTAKEIRHCSTWTFRPDGTYATTELGAMHGTYRVRGKTVTLFPINDDGTRDKAYDLTLSIDGTKLGDMKRL